jgi:4-amino-4-deoxy-L-arabinose transferase-like glycosyltransferase
MRHIECRQESLKVVLSKHSSLLGILLGSVLILISLGPYYNWDSQLEYAAASGIMKWGLPYITFGNLINEAPLAYYIDALFFKTFNLSYETGVGVIALFGIGCVPLVYEIGKILYGQRTGLLSAALFALTPWHVVMSRVFLADAQCLFFSLLYLLVGVWAIRKGSLKMLSVSGVLFGVAFLTKLFALFMLIPLSLIYVYWRPRDLKRALEGIALFFSPAFLLQLLWYQFLSGRGMLSFFSHDDFTHFIPKGIVPPYFFLLSFFVQNPGLFLLLASGFSLLLSFSGRKFFARILAFDLIFFATIIGVAGLNMYLVLGRNLLVPYVDLIKYDYQLLPLFCWLAASLANKFYSLFSQESFKSEHRRLILSVVAIGLFLLIASMVVNLKILNWSTGIDFLLFRAEGGLGYFLGRFPPVMGISSFQILSAARLARINYLEAIQDLGFILIVISLLWTNRDGLKQLRA